MSQKIDKRPFPNTTEKYFLQDKNCNDRIYAYLLLQSKFNPNGRETHRYVEKMSNLQIAADLKLNKLSLDNTFSLIRFTYFLYE